MSRHPPAPSNGEQASALTILPDVLPPGLTLVFCGTAPSRRSAAEHAYYAHPGNHFWRALAETGLTPRLYAPGEYIRLPALGIGLTDLAKHASGNDAELPPDAFDIAALHRRIRRCQPQLIAFTSKNAARAALGRIASWGEQASAFEGARAFVLPSPSGQARGHWDLAPWQQVADACHAARRRITAPGAHPGTRPPSRS